MAHAGGQAVSEFEKVVEIMARANARECSEEGDWEGYEDGIAAAIRAIRSKGWAIVSRKATKEMADIGADVLAKEHANFFVNRAYLCFHKMLAAGEVRDEQANRAALRAEAMKLIEEMEGLAAKADKGPWEAKLAGIYACESWFPRRTFFTHSAHVLDKDGLNVSTQSTDTEAPQDKKEMPPTTKFIARSRAAVPELCRLLRAALGEE